MTKSWRIDDFAPEAASFYKSLERDLLTSVYHPISATRFCLNEEDAKRSKRRVRNPRYENVLDAFQEAGAEGDDYADDHGSVRIEGASWVDLPEVLNVLRNHFKKSGHLECADFDYQKLSPSEAGWTYEGIVYRGVIFCEGSELPRNPWFGHLPLTPAKGETLLCESDDPIPENQLLHHEKWFLPYSDGSFRIGATYDEADLSDAPTDAGRTALVNAFNQLKRKPRELRILKQLSGLRPSTQDARPFLGEHPKEKGLFVFNGLGSKGASLAPTLSRELIDHICSGVALEPETDILRFSK